MKVKCIPNVYGSIKDRKILDAIEQARQLEKKYNAPVVWMGKNTFIVVKDGKEITVKV